MRILISACFFLSLLVASAPDWARAMGVTPLVIELRSGSTNRSAQIIVNNDAAVDAPVEIDIQRVDLDEDGQQHLFPGKSDFVIFPPMRLIPAHAKQVFKLQWAGAALAKSQTYLFLVTQPPVQMPNAQSGVLIDFKFQVIVNVAPPSGTRSIDLVASSVVTSGGKKYASLVVSNSGNVHALLGDATVTLRSGSWSRVLPSGDLQQIFGLGAVQPGKKRRFLFPVESPRDTTTVAAEVSYNMAFH